MKVHWLIPIVCLTCVGCTAVNPPTRAQLSEARRQGQVDLPKAIRDKVDAAVFLLVATSADIDWTPMTKGTPGWGDTLRNELSNMDPAKTSYGLAFAIDSRGFLLTAAHCVENRRFVYICGRIGGTPTVLQASLVHLSKSVEPGGEYALLQVECRLPDVLLWGTLPKPSDQLFAVSELVEPVGANFVAGRMVSCYLTRDDPRLRIVETTIPLWKGDSGGPLLEKDGAVVGVNTGGYLGIHFGGKVFLRGHWHGQGISSYPDPERIRMLIWDKLNDREPNPDQR